MSSETGGFDELRESHYERFIGPLTQPVLHPLGAQPLHIDVYQFEPTADRDYWTLITSGMSDARQLEPEQCLEHQSTRAELLIYATEPKPWMFNVLRGLAAYPFGEQRHLHWWHTVQNGAPMAPEPSELTAFLLLPPYHEPEQFGSFTLEYERVDFLWVIPITESERLFAVEHGSDALEDRLAEIIDAAVIDEQRASVV